MVGWGQDEARARHIVAADHPSGVVAGGVWRRGQGVLLLRRELRLQNAAPRELPRLPLRLRERNQAARGDATHHCRMARGYRAAGGAHPGAPGAMPRARSGGAFPLFSARA